MTASGERHLTTAERCIESAAKLDDTQRDWALAAAGAIERIVWVMTRGALARWQPFRGLDRQCRLRRDLFSAVGSPSSGARPRLAWVVDAHLVVVGVAGEHAPVDFFLPKAVRRCRSCRDLSLELETGRRG